MNTKRLAVAVFVSAVVLVGAAAASAAMHATLGAHLSGMGEHGIVNLQSNAAKGKLCWTFDADDEGDHGRVDSRHRRHEGRRARHALHGEGL